MQLDPVTQTPAESAQEPTRPDVSVVIVSWNTREITKGCLQSVFEQAGGLSLEVFVVDNDSADGTADMVRQDFPQVHLIANDENVGFAAGNNLALPRCEGRYVLLLNPDTRIKDRAVERVVGFADQRPKAAVVGCRVMMNDRDRQDTCFRFPGPLNLLLIAVGAHRLPGRFFGRARYGGWQRDDVREVDVVTGMFMLVRREAIQEVGHMDADYFIYGEEADWCYRFWKAGWTCVFTPDAEIVHLDGGGQSTKQIRVRMFVQLQKSLLQFNRKNLGWTAYASARLILLGSMLGRGLAWSALRLLGRGGAANKARCAWAAVVYLAGGPFPGPAAKTQRNASEATEGESVPS